MDGSDFGACLGQVLPEAVDDCQTPADEDCDGFAITSCEGFYPLPPTGSDFGWQTLQERFVLDGAPCHAEVTVAVGSNATCYAGADDRLYCAGAVLGSATASPYIDMGLEGPLQILLGGDSGNGICALLRNGTMMCGGLNDHGQFGLGHEQPVDTFTAWGGRDDIARVATNTFETICALTTSGEVLCAGAGFGDTPVFVGNGTKVWVDLDGGVHLDESPIRRVSPGMSWCTIDGAGVFDCPLFTVPLLVDEVVDGGLNSGTSGGEACYLDVDGEARVSCTHLILLSKETIQHFEPGAVLALATSAGDAPLCAVYVDGSLWCVGANYAGQLGFEWPVTLWDDTQILPAGSVRTACE